MELILFDANGTVTPPTIVTTSGNTTITTVENAAYATTVANDGNWHHIQVTLFKL